ncbi:MAG: C69 family dipeptidase [Erysipelotrichaceae bacterium]|uniref:C69 family dipeptidase n=1 Tax=Floccifex sp. TaxID=2815810 RepID=UPI002A765DA2|nr:C69 family dipeptidase [Floccifex sp.]MDD7280903.1 C69 family dipeptidase [Erysipelotrichaceae bacterium]MDY2958574.1 C69 family dipeptidase [Floccifex sp.]
MACTTLLVGKNASYDGSTMIARNEDSCAGQFETKKLWVVTPEQQPRHYKSVISKVEIDLPDNPMRYTSVPSGDGIQGIWAAAGVNEENISMTATETLTSNPLVLGADPLVENGIGEEDLVTLTLPYIHNAREGVIRLGMLHETYGTYEMNGIAFSDVNEIWWFETIGGHHWMARRVPDDCYVVMPNQLGIDYFDFEDAYGKQENYMCSSDLKEFVIKNHLNLSMDGNFDPRSTFGSHSDADHVYNTPRAWYMLKYFNPELDIQPLDDNLPWCYKPNKKITVEDVKYILSSHYQGTEYDPYLKHGNKDKMNCFRTIGINRNNFLSCVQLRPYVPKQIQAVEWICFASNVYNAFIPFYGNVNEVPAFYSTCESHASTNSLYWTSRIIAALADPEFNETNAIIERYQEKVASIGHHIINQYDEKFMETKDLHMLVEANEEIAKQVQELTYDVLDKVLFIRSNNMKNKFSLSD